MAEFPRPLVRQGEFSESGRGLPIALSRPGGALPYSPLVAQAYAPSPSARLGWAQGEIRCDEVPLDPPRAIPPTAAPAAAAALFIDGDDGYVVVARDDFFAGVIYLEELFGSLAGHRVPATVEELVSTQIPTCAPKSALVDAVRQMIACYLRCIPVVGESGLYLGLLPLAVAAQAGTRDPAVRDVLETAARSPAWFARRWR